MSLDLFAIGIGPSSSHTVGPMKAAYSFLNDSIASFYGQLSEECWVEAHLFGTLALTGKGHGTDKAICWGLLGHLPHSLPLDQSEELLSTLLGSRKIELKEKAIKFDPSEGIHYHRTQELPGHPNGMQFVLYGTDGDILVKETVYSVGGGFLVTEGEETLGPTLSKNIPFPITSGAQLLDMAHKSGLSISSIGLANELAGNFTSEKEVFSHVDRLIETMFSSIERGLRLEGTLPGGLKVKRRAPGIAAQLRPLDSSSKSQDVLRWVNVFALAVSEENAAGGRMVTAPTNGAAGIIPAVLKYVDAYELSEKTKDERAILLRRFLVCASVIGSLYKENASISGAEVGCQGEVGVACSMAAAGLAEILGGTPLQVENAAEIGMEHNLGLTCDPIGGLVQIPCIERNAMGAVKAINAATLALSDDGLHHVSLDKVIETMKETGKDMQKKYKETSRGGLAVYVNIPEC